MGFFLIKETVIEENPTENGSLVERDSEDKFGERLDSSVSSAAVSGDGSDMEEENKSERNEKEKEASLSNDIRKKLCLKTKPEDSSDVKLHPILVEEWTNWMRQRLYDEDEKDEKKREEEERKACDEITKKFARKGDLQVKAPKQPRNFSVHVRYGEK